MSKTGYNIIPCKARQHHGRAGEKTVKVRCWRRALHNAAFWMRLPVATMSTQQGLDLCNTSTDENKGENRKGKSSEAKESPEGERE